MSDYSKLSHQQLLSQLNRLQSSPQLITTTEQSDVLLHELQVHQVELEIQNRELREAQGQLEFSRQRYLTLYDMAPVGYLQLNREGRIKAINSAGEALLAKPHAQLVGRSFSDWLTNTADRKFFQEHLQHALAHPGQIQRLELIIQKQNGQPCCLLVISQALADCSLPKECYTVLVDITDRVRAAALEHDVQHDTLTGLANRNLLMQRLSLALQRAFRHEDFHFALLFVDLNRFKAINDTLGHQVGDQVLIALADHLQQFVRQMDLAARLGGDEFVILLEHITGLHQAVQVAERIVESLHKPLQLLSGRDLIISASIGIVVGPDHYRNAGELLRDADIAMYRAKKHARRAIEIFDPDMRAGFLEQLQLEQELRRALEDDIELVLHFQPIVELATGEVKELEALVRWQHPRCGLLEAKDFVSMAEESSLAVPLGEWVIEKACQQMQRWRERFPAARDLVVSVNLSPLQCQNRQFPEHLATVMERSGLPRHSLNLELSERYLMSDTLWFCELLGRLGELGVSLTIDDFGTGFSSLSQLPGYTLKHLKVDASVINGTDANSHHAKIALIIINLAQQLSLNVVAKGIETPEQLTFLRQAGCSLGQGKLFSPACVGADLESLMGQYDKLIYKLH